MWRFPVSFMFLLSPFFVFAQSAQPAETPGKVYYREMHAEYGNHNNKPEYGIAVRHMPMSMDIEGVETRVIPIGSVCKSTEYPPESLNKQESGTIRFAVRVSSEGRVVESELIESSGVKRLDAVASEAFLSCSFHPFVINDIPAETWIVVSFYFNLAR